MLARYVVQRRLIATLSALILSLISGCVPVFVDSPDLLVRGYSPEAHECMEYQNAKRVGLQPEAMDHCHEFEQPQLFPRGNKGELDPSNLPLMQEWAFNKTDVHSPPKACLALSGGGMRSASFSLGVLKALSLHKKQPTALRNASSDLTLDDIDVISAVSGGAYALGWLVMQHYNFHHRRVENASQFQYRDLFDEKTSPSAIDYVRQHATLSGRLGRDALIALSLAASPINLALNGILGWHANTTPARAAYERRLREIFATDPRSPADVPSDLSFNDLLSHYAGYANGNSNGLGSKPTYFVINTTAFIEEDLRHRGGKLANSIYEFTLLQYGSDALGRYVYPRGGRQPVEGDRAEQKLIEQFLLGKRHLEQQDGEPMRLMRSVSVSGASIDSSALYSHPSQRTLSTAANLDLGFYIDNPGVNDATRFFHRVLPYPLYFHDHHYLRDVDGARIYLSDGGHSENLGVFSLVRRLCDEIIVVDAEHDPTYQFEGYTLLRENLRAEIGAVLSVPHIDAQLDTIGKDHNSVKKAFPSLLPTKRKRDEFLKSHKRWKIFADDPVMDGDICCIPRPGGKTHIKVHYIKLAYFAECGDDAADVNDKVKEYFCSSDNDEREYPFPQEPTTDQWYTPGKFDAYMTLGYCIMAGRFWAAQAPYAGSVPGCDGWTGSQNRRN